ncbi:MAG: hypothetical protein J6L77_07495 [Coprococcus sp.]|nr:hypothetical protein [Coprococcus sp.]
MKKIIRNLCVIPLAVLLAISSVGCGKKEDVSNDIQNLESGETADSGLKEKLGIEETHVSYEIGSTGVGVEADITIPDAGNVGIYEMQPRELTSEYMKSVADKLFDDGEYSIYYPAAVYNMDDRKAFYSEATKELEENPTQLVNSRWFDLYLTLEAGETKYVQGNLNTDEFAFYDIGDTNGYITSLLMNIFRQFEYVYAEGNVDGKRSRITFFRYKDGAETYAMGVETEMNRDYYYMEDYDNKINNDMYGTPALSHTDEELEILIDDYLSKFGFEEFGISDRKLLCLFNSAETVEQQLASKAAIGYCYILTREKAKVQNHYDEIGGEQIKLYITAEGIVGSQFVNMYDIANDKETDTTLLKWEQIDEIFQNQVIADYESKGKRKSVKCNRIEFEYRVTNIDDHMIMTPVWIYSVVDDYLKKEEVFMIINAVDGTVIDIY